MTPQRLEDLKCIWMSSGIVDYRLCDLQFDCDNCEFDLAMKSRQPHKPRAAGSLGAYFANLRDKVENVHNSEIVTVLNNNLTLRRIYKNSYMLGLSSYVWLLLGQEVTCTLEKGYLRKGDNAFTLKGEWGMVSVASPFDAYLVSSFVNQSGQVQSGAWLGLVEADEDSVNQSILEFDAYKEKSIRSLEEMIGRYNIIEPFSTMNDGGSFVDSLYKVTGREQFRKMMETLLNP